MRRSQMRKTDKPKRATSIRMLQISTASHRVHCAGCQRAPERPMLCKSLPHRCTKQL